MNVALLTITLTAAASLSANRFVTSGGAVPAAAARCIGVTRTGAGTGDLVPVDVLGTAMVEVGSGGVTLGANVETDNTGKAVAYSAGVKLGTALHAASAGQLVEVLLIAN